MAHPRARRRPWWLLGLAVLAAALVAGAGGSLVLKRQARQGQAMRIPDGGPAADETLRRQVLWSLTSGAAGEFAGSDDWEFHAGWEGRLPTRALGQSTRLRALFSRMPWWRLVPDTGGELVTAGRGTGLRADTPMDVLDNDHVTAARTPDGRLAVVYLPTRRRIAVDRSAMAAGTRAAWVDPTSGARRPVPMSATFTTPGRNGGGDEDWLLVLSS